MNFRILRCVLIATVALSKLGLLVADEYLLSDLGTLPGDISSRAAAINNRGEVVGWSNASDGLTHAFRWRQGAMTPLLIPDSLESLASDINNLGDIVGAVIRDGKRRAFLCRNDQVVDLGIIDGFLKLGDAGNYNPGVGVNDLRQVTCRLTLEDGQQRSVFWRQGQGSVFRIAG
ncbi:MAG TPA: hypothetical protein EYQ50_00545 [Verrucomicrobiales bacterium]|nr:hypothetical protein [Verrucomicrobiales bacterium]